MGNVLSAIVRENCTMNQKSMRGKENKHWAELLLSKMNNIFKFNDDNMTLVQRYAMIMFTTSLSLWKYRANRLLDEGKDLEEDIKPLYPTTSYQEWAEFLAYRETEQYQTSKKIGKNNGRKCRGTIDSAPMVTKGRS